MWSHESGAGSVGAGAAAANSRLSWCGVTQSRQPGTSSFSLLSKCQMTEHICYNIAWTQERASRRGDRENSIPSPLHTISVVTPLPALDRGGCWVVTWPQQLCGSAELAGCCLTLTCAYRPDWCWPRGEEKP